MPKKSLKYQIIEKRLSPRKRLKAMVNVVREENRTSEKAVNHSLTGLFLKCNLPEQYTIDEKVGVSFKDDNGTDQTHSGKIIRKTREGIAIHYQENPDD